MAYTKAISQRFWSKVKIQKINECWKWCACTWGGYGEFGLYGKVIKAHRMAWILTFGEIPTGMCVCHTCGERSCCNPRHLELIENGNESKKWEKNLWSHVTKSAKGCWKWSGAYHPFGYGVFRRKWTPEFGRGKMSPVHRITFELANGPIPKGMSVLHKCDNPPCCNPAHLFLGTQQDNIDDCIKKGRKVSPHGDRKSNAKITDEIAREVRKSYVPNSRTLGANALARKYGIASSNMFQIIKGNAWKHVV